MANDLGYAWCACKITQENGCTLQIMAEDENGRFAITDCERLQQGPLAGARRRGSDRPRISSRGLARPASTGRWCAPAISRAYIGHEAKIELSDLLDGRKRFRGDIEAVDDDSVTIRLPDAPKGTDPDHTPAARACWPKPSW